MNQECYSILLSVCLSADTFQPINTLSLLSLSLGLVFARDFSIRHILGDGIDGLNGMHNDSKTSAERATVRRAQTQMDRRRGD